MNIFHVALIALILVSVRVGFARAAYGMDISSQTCERGVSLSTWKCLTDRKYELAVIEVWQGGYGINTNIASCVKNAWSAGMKQVDLYVFMCPNCGGNENPTTVIDEIASHTLHAGLKFGRLWFDIEQCDGCWSDFGTNERYIQQASSHAKSIGFEIGFYSSEYEWSITMGSSTAFHTHPLWYAHYDDMPSFSDTAERSFGGWTKPYMKQFTDSGPCLSIDQNWLPSIGPAPPPPPPPPPPKPIKVGDVVTPTVSSLNCRSSASTSASVVDTWGSGNHRTVTSGPKTADGYTWWKVNSKCWSVNKYLKHA